MYLEETQTVRGANHAERSELDHALDGSDALSVMDCQGMKYCLAEGWRGTRRRMDERGHKRRTAAMAI